MRILSMCCVLAFLSGYAQTNSVPQETLRDEGIVVVVEGTPIAKYRAETISTATFADAKPEELPQTVDVLTEDLISEMNPLDLHDMLRHQAGIYTGGKSMMDRTSGQYTIRGMSGSDVMLNGTLGLAGPMGIFMDPSAFERIEIVKGPVGSTIGGATSTMGPYGAGGSINLVMKSPSFEDDLLLLRTRSLIGKHTQRYGAGVDINQRIVEDRLAVRLPGNIEYGRPFWLRNGYDWRQSYFLAPSLLALLRDDLRVGINLSFQYTDQPGYQGIPIYKGKPFADYKWDSNDSLSDMRDKYYGHTIEGFLEWDATRCLTLRSGAGMALADIEFEHVGPGAFANTATGKPLPLPLANPYDHQEGDMLYRRYNIYERAIVTLETGPIDHQLVVQGDFTRKTGRGRSYFEPVATPYAVHTWVPANHQNTQLDKWGFLAQDYLSWWKLRVLGGGRFDYHKSNRGNTGTSFSPRGGLSFIPQEWLVLFYNASFTESPNFGYNDKDNRELTSSWQAYQHEAGFRVSPNQKLWLSTSVYRIEQKNTPVALPGDRTRFTEEGGNESQGVELSLTGNILDNWSVYGSYAYNEYESKHEKRHFDRYPPHSLTASTSYRMEGGPLDDIVFGLGYRFRHRYSATMLGQYVGKDFYIDNSHVFDCSLDIPLSKFGGSQDVTLSLAIKNIFDKRYIESNRHYYQGFPGDPRVFEVALQARF